MAPQHSTWMDDQDLGEGRKRGDGRVRTSRAGSQLQRQCGEEGKRGDKVKRRIRGEMRQQGKESSMRAGGQDLENKAQN